MARDAEHEQEKQAAAAERAAAKQQREQDREQDKAEREQAKDQREQDREARKAEEKVDDDAEGAAEEGNEEVQGKTDEAEEKGYIGTVPDPTPNENYTVEGVTSGKPTPETDPDLAAEARAAVRGAEVPVQPKKDGE
jgi:hypothetical protein